METEFKQGITPKELALVGLEQFAYMKPVVIDGQPQVAIHTADGNMVGLVPTRDAAWVAIRQNQLEPVSVH